ncbi:glycosyltransferase [Jeotgalibacillus sp. ET6]|uniref:glycosyltransferase n=1 Tax=Jeotgalibacillus sp. ET6 TaxID=3037260 RepID=UPI002418A227|nr:glycosyltransferase [Jeotgalibacillus sp. ET6]MDG5472350.1 glycosyltransferase [Jeotgalibacillus sp. ET6]
MADTVWLVLAVEIMVLFLLYRAAKRGGVHRRILLSLFLLLNAVYLIWRAVETLPTFGIISLVLGILLLATEIMGFVQSIVFTILSWKPFRRKHIPLTDLDQLPSVDILIATYNEPEDLLKRTIVACTMLRYPEHLLRVYVCDDGKRESVRELTESLGARYISRTGNEHAKAGNLNDAMLKTKGEIIVTMDADMVPKEEFLERTVGHFKDEHVSFVQAPQVFYNADPFQYNLFFEDNITNEQDFFMRSLEEGKDRFNATMYVGSNALFRRSALDAIGGFATGVITEDMATGMLLQTGKQRSVFVNETLAVGLSPETYADLLKQRDRWCRGNIQVARKWNPMTIKGLTWMQRLLYMDGINYWFFGVYKMIYLLAPLLFLVFGIYSLDTEFLALLAFWLPAFISSQLAFRLLSDQKRTVLWSHVYEVALAPYMALSVLTESFLKKNVKFNVTAKGIQSEKRQFLWRVSIPYFVLIGFTAMAFAQVSLHLFTPLEIYENNDMLYINIFWILYNLLALVLALMISVERPRFRGAERHKVDLNGMIRAGGQEFECVIKDMSETGFRFEITHPNAEKWLSKEQNFLLNAGEIKDLNFEKLWVSDSRGGPLSAGGKFNSIDLNQYRSIVKILYLTMVDRYTKRIYNRSSIWRVFVQFTRGTEYRPKRFERSAVREMVSIPASLSLEDGEVKSIITDYSIGGCRVELKRTRRIKAGDSVEIHHTNAQLALDEGRVQWVQQRGRKTLIGVQFIADVQYAASSTG